MSYKNLVRDNVSRETLSLICEYVQLLKKWNKKIPLISKLASEEIIYKHILSCLELKEIIKNKENSIIDIGSGNGLPGIILAILGYTNCTLVEINHKKSIFLKELKKYLKIKVHILNEDIKNFQQDAIDYIILKAVGNIERSLELSFHIVSPTTEILLYKNQENVNYEIEQAFKKWSFDWEIKEKYQENFPIVLHIKNLSLRKNENHIVI